MRILITSRMFGVLDREPIDLLAREGYEIVDHPYRGTTLGEDRLLELVENVDAAIVGDDYFTAAVIAKANRLKIIAKYGVGVDRIDLQAATDKGIVVSNIPGGNKHAVADLTLTLMLAISRQLMKAHEVVKQSGWSVVTGREIYRKTLGVVGMGQIGKEVIRRAKGFQMNIAAYDPYPDQAFVQEHGVRLVSAEELMRISDFVSLHLPSLPSTRGFVDRRMIALMKPTAYLINTARGDIVEETALVQALQERRIAGAALDTLAQEPPGNHPLLHMDNVIVTPHIAGHSYEANYTIGMSAARSVIGVLRGGKPEHIVNPEVYDRGVRSVK
ncbi:phosphoglycerate dehydrogenase [Paenibacillus sp. J2TS4]|uniref:phosphoglycerate dehydrogenase n=1 Tax=Paenibacillus sp. J2TS4 TaxID=2807194 RepID=UPI001AFCE52D|nr:phosphoglycerate dehydrogenase [Paenibacillus sp. J2TS4]GIP36116.1 2-hydroxyacid dehydrogenase [Paenibacillus sp. J2TS4]